MLQSVDFMVSFICRKDAVLQVQRSCSLLGVIVRVIVRRKSNFVILLTVRLFFMRYLKEDSIMEILNIVFPH